MGTMTFDIDRAIELFQAGATNDDIAEELGMTVSTVSVTLGALGLHRNVRSTRRQKIAELYRLGYTAKQIAPMVGLTTQYIRQEIAKMGLRKRRV